MHRLEDVEVSDYDFLDFGAGTGGSLQFCSRRFGGRGLGVDTDPRKVEAAQLAGHAVVLGDLTALPRRPLVRYVSMCDFLEHLPDHDLVQEMLSVAAAVATDFIFIRHPSFEDEAYLRALGLKQYWQDWKGHPSHLLLCDLTAMLREVGADKLRIEYIRPIGDSGDPTILPVDAPPDQHDYDPELHGPKREVTFAKPVHRMLDVTAHLDGSGQPGSWRQDQRDDLEWERGWFARLRPWYSRLRPSLGDRRG